MPAGQKKAPDFITDGSEPPCGYWKLNSGPLEEQAVLLTSEPSLQPPTYIFKAASSCYVDLSYYRPGQSPGRNPEVMLLLVVRNG